MAIGAFVGLVGFSLAFEDELAFPAWRGARLSPV
jgi:hypothetical protein